MDRDSRHNRIPIQGLRRHGPRSIFPQESPFRARFGAFYPHPAHKSAPRAAWATHPGHCSPASRPTPNQRGEVLCRLSPAGYCLPPTAQLPITERARSRRAGPLFQYVTEPGDFYGQNHLFLSTRRRSPVDRSLVAKALNPSLFRHACRMAISRNACSLLDFPEFAQAVRYGVPGTRCINETLPWYLERGKKGKGSLPFAPFVLESLIEKPCRSVYLETT